MSDDDPPPIDFENTPKTMLERFSLLERHHWMIIIATLFAIALFASMVTLYCTGFELHNAPKGCWYILLA